MCSSQVVSTPVPSKGSRMVCCCGVSSSNLVASQGELRATESGRHRIFSSWKRP